MKKYIFIIIILLILPTLVFSFGKNKINHKNIDWSLMKTTHFDIYYEKDLDFVGKITTDIIEKAYYKFQKLFEYSLPQRIPVIIYNSHNEFEETNTIYNVIGEGVGGFTEFIKNRVVVPFDGSYKRFELTVMHELCHVFCFYVLQGGNIQNFATGIFFSLPLWFSEGIAEFCSIHGSEFNDMYMMDLLINDKIVPLDEVTGYKAYREGESFLLFLESKFGTNSIFELLYNFKVYKTLNQTMKKTFGYSIEKLENEWKLYLQRKYSKLIMDNSVPFSRYDKITHHKANENNMNLDPVFSPNGKDILYFSDRLFTTNIYRRSTLGLYNPKKLIKSGHCGSYEDFHYLKSSLSFFPGGKKFAFVIKTSFGDAIAICRTKDGNELDRIKLDFDSIFEIDISPNGKSIVLAGLKDAKCDLYIYDLITKTTSRITDDYYDDRYPKWSSDGKKIVFSSQRFVDKIFKKSREDQIFSNLHYNIFIYNTNDDKISALTNEPFDHIYPIWTEDENYIIFSSYEEGIANIYAYNINKEGFTQITDILCGTFCPSITKDNKDMVFSTYYDGGWDLYLAANTLDSLSYYKYEEIRYVDEFPFKKVFNIADYAQYYEVKKQNLPKEKKITYHSKYFLNKRDSIEQEPKKDKNKKPEKEDYKIIFTPDYIFGGLSYTTGYGLSAMMYIALSDILGNHHLNIISDINKEISESNIIFNYFYLKQRLDYKFGIFNLVDDYYYLNKFTDGTFIYDGRKQITRTGIYAGLSYPLDKYNRLDFDNVFHYWQEEWFYWSDNDWHHRKEDDEKSWVYASALFYIHDTAIWGYTGPIKGSRMSIGIEKSMGGYNDYLNFYADIRKYLPITLNYQFATRLDVGFSTGIDKQDFIMGGYYNMRGYLNKEFLGNNIAIMSLEFRYPFIEDIKIGFPLPLWLKNIRGAVFTDVGKVWDNFEQFKSNKKREIKMGYGIGTRMNMGYFILKFDWAYRADRSFEDQTPSFYFSLNAEF